MHPGPTPPAAPAGNEQDEQHAGLLCLSEVADLARRDGGGEASESARREAARHFDRSSGQFSRPRGLAASAPPPNFNLAFCWGQELSGGMRHCAQVVPRKAGPAFRERFCSECRARGVIVSASRLRVVCGRAPTNQHTGGIWNEGSDNGWPQHRVVNQVCSSTGPPLVILREETTATFAGLAAMPPGESGWVRFRVGRTLEPLIGLPATPEPPRMRWQPACAAPSAASPGVSCAPAASGVMLGSGSGPFEQSVPFITATATANATGAFAPAPMPNPFPHTDTTPLLSPMPAHALPLTVAMAMPLTPSLLYFGIPPALPSHRTAAAWAPPNPSEATPGRYPEWDRPRTPPRPSAPERRDGVQ